MKKILLFAALAFPILGLLILTGIRAYRASTGYEMTFHVDGYDPRDLLSGRYVLYRVNYGPTDRCDEDRQQSLDYSRNDKNNREFEHCVCYSDPPDPDTGYWQSCESIEEASCPVFIRGTCNYGRFSAGIEKFFVPEEKADYYDQVLRKYGARLTVKIDDSGQPAISDLELPLTFEDWQNGVEPESGSDAPFNL